MLGLEECHAARMNRRSRFICVDLPGYSVYAGLIAGSGAATDGLYNFGPCKGYASTFKATMEPSLPNTAFMGGDYRFTPIETPESCSDICGMEAQCQSFSYVPPGTQGPTAVCWLKSSVPPATPAPGLVSGVKR